MRRAPAWEMEMRTLMESGGGILGQERGKMSRETLALVFGETREPLRGDFAASPG